MNIPGELLNSYILWFAWVPWLLLIMGAIYLAPWRRFTNSTHLNLYLGMLVTLALIWRLQAGVEAGLSLHLLGAALLMLSFGTQLAFVGLNLILLFVSISNGDGMASFAINALLMGGLSIGITYLAWLLIDRYLPNNLFVYLFGLGFFASGLSILCVGICSTLLLSLSGAYNWAHLSEYYLPYFVLLSFAEGWLTGMVTTLLVVYFPGWMATFNDNKYLRRTS